MLKKIVIFIMLITSSVALSGYTSQKEEELLKRVVEAHRNLGNAYYAKGLFDKSIVEYIRALKIDANYTDARLNLGAAYAQKRLLYKAIDEWKEAIKVNPDLTEAYFNIALAYKDRGDSDESKEYLQKAAALAKDEKFKKEIELLLNE